MFNPNEFPDVPSGSVSEKLVDLGYESFIRIDSSTLITEEETRRYSSETVYMKWRKLFTISAEIDFFCCVSILLEGTHSAVACFQTNYPRNSVVVTSAAIAS